MKTALPPDKESLPISRWRLPNLILAAGIVNKNPTHGFSGGGKEVPAALPHLILRLNQT
jgi:hypothetical protein